jgi:hypothetical protein
MSGRGASPVLLALLGAALSNTACYDLNKVKVPPRWIDDFSNTSMPTWSVFSTWGCGTYLIEQPPEPDGGAGDGGRTDAGTDATIDAGGAPLPACPRGGPGVLNVADRTDTADLAYPFDVPKGFGALVETKIEPPGEPADFTAFRQLVFSANLLSASNQAPLPSTTVLTVVIGCARNGSDHLASQTVPGGMLVVDSNTWWSVHLDLSAFYVTQTVVSQTCLSEVDSISFEVTPGNSDLPSGAGTLSLDNISLQN